MISKFLYLSLLQLAFGFQPYIKVPRVPMIVESNDFFSGRTGIINKSINLLNSYKIPNINQEPAQGRIFMSFLEKFSPISFKILHKEKPSYTPLRKTCRKGHLVDEQCFEIFLSKLNFDDARKACINLGGDLWTPEFNDVFLLQNLVTHLPGFFEIPGEDLWLGAKRTNGKTVTVRGKDVSNTFLVNVDQNDQSKDGECLVFDFSFGAASTLTENCVTASQEFICEFPYDYHDKRYYPYAHEI